MTYKRQDTKANLKKLAEHLLKLPEDYEKFDMSAYCIQKSTRLGIAPYRAYSLYKKCDTVACAAGHGPAAGIGINTTFSSWQGYIQRYFGFSDESDQWEWMFSSQWEKVDNSPQGAARRILWYLKHGIPENYKHQRIGSEKLCYINP